MTPCAVTTGFFVLRRCGRPAVAACPSCGRPICAQHVGNIHLLLTDVVMPRMGGRELAERAAALRPEMKVLYMSGYAGEEMLKEGALSDPALLLQKPIAPASLARRVREALDAR